MSWDGWQLESKINDVDDQQVHIWCYTHILTLAIIETTKCVPAISFLNLLQYIATFVKAIEKRMAISIEVVGKHLRQEKIKAN